MSDEDYRDAGSVDEQIYGEMASLDFFKANEVKRKCRMLIIGNDTIKYVGFLSDTVETMTNKQIGEWFNNTHYGYNSTDEDKLLLLQAIKKVKGE